MAFRKVDPQTDFPALEREMLAFWDRIDAFGKLRAKNAGKQKWSFLDGPITANNPMGVHHAWGRTYKDAYQRYFAMTGHELRYQNGFDCQGLWVEVEVERDLVKQGHRIDTKRDIENLIPGDKFSSVDRFVQACKDRVNTFARVQTEQSIRLGYWMDWDRTDADWAKPPGERKSYFTMAEENNYTIWSFLKKCHHRGFVYKAYDAMPWCARCGTGISQQEMNEGYKITVHRAIFVKFPLRDRVNEHLLAWTTTPWTLTSNVAAAVHPELTYLKIELGGQFYYVGKGAFKHARLEEQFKDKSQWAPGVPKLKTLEQLFKEKAGKEGFRIVEELPGSQLVGLAYDGPFDELPAQGMPFGYPEETARVVETQKWAPAVSGQQVHRVLGWKEVGETEGTGIVHIAPGCGKEDFALGKEQGIPPIAPLDETGTFREGFGPLAGKSALDPFVVEFVIGSLKEKDRLFNVEPYPHKYPHCWRCKEELLYRLVDEWFIRMDWRNEIAEIVTGITWLPESINGEAREKDWLVNMGDWMISKKRFWGLALPIWVDPQTGDFDVIGSYEELKSRAVEGWAEFEGHTPHRPWIDLVKLRNPKTGNLMHRIGDVGNPWLDAGIVPYSTMQFASDPDYWEDWFPADLVTESFPGQFRNWFYSLLAMSTMMTGRAPFRTLLGHASVRDQEGHEMHKSAGNSIEFIGAADSGFTLDHELDGKQTPKLPEGATSFEVIERQKKTDKGYVAVQAVRASYPPISADVIRWLYCRQNPAANVNFGPVPADELRAKFVLKLWNTYSFFCTYARLDAFDPTTPAVPMERRPDIDRWILSDLQTLIEQANTAFREYSVMDFCLAAERFVDDKLSNWYIRRNRRRFWKSDAGDDKLAAYQTLYTVLTTLTKLFAPVVPFLTEEMHGNLRAESDPESVHLCDYPQVDETLRDPALSEEVDAMLRLVSLGLSARQVAKIKVRQPLAELRVRTNDPAEQRAIERFSETIADELNVKKVTLHGSEPLMRAEAKLSMKTAAAKLGAKSKEAQAELATLDAETLGQRLRTGPLELAGVPLESADFIITYTASTGFAGVAEGQTQAVVDTRLTPELAAEGMARDIVRLVQDLRKKSGLEMEDRIELYLTSPVEKLAAAIESQREYIAAETLTTGWTTLPDAVEQKIDGQSLMLALRKA